MRKTIDECIRKKVNRQRIRCLYNNFETNKRCSKKCSFKQVFCCDHKNYDKIAYIKYNDFVIKEVFTPLKI